MRPADFKHWARHRNTVVSLSGYSLRRTQQRFFGCPGRKGWLWLKILHIAQILQGGTAAHICELLALQGREWGNESIYVLAPQDQVSFLEDLEDVSVLTFPSSRRDFGSLWGFAKAARRALVSINPDIIHLHGSYAGLVGRLVARFGRYRRTPIVYCSHGWSFNMRVSPRSQAVYGSIERLLASRTDAILCISRYEHDSAVAHGLPRERLVTIHNGIAVTPSTGNWRRNEGSAGLPLLFAGRDCRQKGFDVLLEAMGRLGDADVHVVAVGPEPRPSDPETVTAVGWRRRRDLKPFYEACLAVVVPSRWEGFGLVALEAMRNGRAVIASDVDGLCDLVVPGVTGILVSPNDSEAWSRTLSSLDSEMLREMGRRGRARFLELFTSQTMHEKILQIYRQLLPPEVVHSSSRHPEAPARLSA